MSIVILTLGLGDMVLIRSLNLGVLACSSAGVTLRCCADFCFVGLVIGVLELLLVDAFGSCFL